MRQYVASECCAGVCTCCACTQRQCVSQEYTVNSQSSTFKRSNPDATGTAASDSKLTRTRDEQANVRWSWSGCSDNVRYGMEFSRQFLSEWEREQFEQSGYAHVEHQVRIHNADVGREVSVEQSVTHSMCLSDHQTKHASPLSLPRRVRLV